MMIIVPRNNSALPKDSSFLVKSLTVGVQGPLKGPEISSRGFFMLSRATWALF